MTCADHMHMLSSESKMASGSAMVGTIFLSGGSRGGGAG